MDCEVLGGVENSLKTFRRVGNGEETRPADLKTISQKWIATAPGLLVVLELTMHGSPK